MRSPTCSRRTIRRRWPRRSLPSRRIASSVPPSRATRNKRRASPPRPPKPRFRPAALRRHRLSHRSNLHPNRRCHHPRKRMIQYAAALVIEREFPAYWMPAFAGMTGLVLGGTYPLSLRRLLRPGFDLADGVDHGVEGQHGRGMTGLVVAYGLEQGDVGPFALRGGTVFLQHLAHGFSQFT